MTARV